MAQLLIVNTSIVDIITSVENLPDRYQFNGSFQVQYDRFKTDGFEIVEVEILPEDFSTELYEWTNGQLTRKKPAPPAPVPQSVTMRQARLALHKQGLLSQVDAALATLPEPQQTEAKIEWEYATTIDRNSSLVSAMASSMSLSDQDLDNLFTIAATL